MPQPDGPMSEMNSPDPDGQIDVRQGLDAGATLTAGEDLADTLQGDDLDRRLLLGRVRLGLGQEVGDRPAEDDGVGRPLAGRLVGGPLARRLVGHARSSSVGR